MYIIPYVYVIGREAGPVKVGVSKSPSRRRAHLQIGCPFRLSVLYEQSTEDYYEAFEVESMVHDLFAARRLMGEWFKTNSDDAALAVAGAFAHLSYPRDPS
jgi:hypothetical protein